MLQLRILDILEQQRHSKYWLWKQMDMSYQNFNKIVNNETSGIKFDTLEKISKILHVPIGELFEQIDENV